MDPIRQIRFLIAPFFYFCFVFMGWLTSNFPCNMCYLRHLETGTIAGIVAVLGAATLPIGFLINSISLIIFWLFRPIGIPIYTGLSDDDIKRIWPLIYSSINLGERKRWYLFKGKQFQNNDKWFTSVTFDHECLKKYSPGIYDWMVRGYSAFTISVNCTIAVVLAFISIYFLEINFSYIWFALAVAITVIMLFGAIIAWNNNTKMEKFQSCRKFNKTTKRPKLGAKSHKTVSHKKSTK